MVIFSRDKHPGSTGAVGNRSIRPEPPAYFPVEPGKTGTGSIAMVDILLFYKKVDVWLKFPIFSIISRFWTISIFIKYFYFWSRNRFLVKKSISLKIFGSVC